MCEENGYVYTFTVEIEVRDLWQDGIFQNMERLNYLVILYIF